MALCSVGEFGVHDVVDEKESLHHARILFLDVGWQTPECLAQMVEQDVGITGRVSCRVQACG